MRARQTLCDIPNALESCRGRQGDGAGFEGLAEIAAGEAGDGGGGKRAADRAGAGDCRTDRGGGDGQDVPQYRRLPDRSAERLERRLPEATLKAVA